MLIKRDRKGTLKVNGIVSERKDISICHQDNTYIPAGKYGYKYYSKRSIAQELNYREKRSYWDGKDYPDKVLYVGEAFDAMVRDFQTLI